MWDLLQQSLLPYNILWTVLLAVIVLYWLMVILGALDIDSLHLDTDADVDADIDVHADMDADADLHGDIHHEADAHADGADGIGGVLHSFLVFFYIGEVPVMILISLFVMTMWFLSLIANAMLNPGDSVLWGFVLTLPALVVGLLMLKCLGGPFKMVFSKLNVDANAPKDVIGQLATVITTQVSKKMGQVQVKTKGAPITLNAKTESGRTAKRGDDVVVLSKDAKTGIFYVEPVEPVSLDD